MMPRKKRRLIIALIVLLIILIISSIGGVIAYLYINTDSFKSDKQLFEKYIAQNITKMVEIINNNPTEINKALNENKYTSEISANIEYTSDVSTSAENKNNSINNAEITIAGNVDKQSNYQYRDITINYNNQTNSEKLARFEYIEENNLKGIRLDNILQFVSFQEENTQKIAENTEIPQESLNQAIQYTKPIEIENTLEFTRRRIRYIKSNIFRNNRTKHRKAIIWKRN